jgi:hypothetical protein
MHLLFSRFNTPPMINYSTGMRWVFLGVATRTLQKSPGRRGRSPRCAGAAGALGQGGRGDRPGPSTRRGPCYLLSTSSWLRKPGTPPACSRHWRMGGRRVGKLAPRAGTIQVQAMARTGSIENRSLDRGAATALSLLLFWRPRTMGIQSSTKKESVVSPGSL